MENTFSYRYFLLINHLSNRMVGMKYLNFAELIISEDNGKFMNSQMTCYFYALDEEFSNLLGNEPMLFLEDLGLDELSEIPPDKLKEDYFSFCFNEDKPFLSLSFF